MFVEAKRTIAVTTAFRPIPKIVVILSSLVMARTSLCCVHIFRLVDYLDAHYKDWTLKENVRAKMRVLIKRILRKHGYPPDKQQQATVTVIQQAELLCGDWAEEAA